MPIKQTIIDPKLVGLSLKQTAELILEACSREPTNEEQCRFYELVRNLGNEDFERFCRLCVICSESDLEYLKNVVIKERKKVSDEDYSGVSLV